MSLFEVFDTLYREFSKRRAFEYLKTLTSKHRIQGSKGIVDACGYVSRMLEDGGVDVELKTYEHPGTIGLFEYPVGWNVYDAEVWLEKPEKKLLHRFIDNPTLVSAHSPPSNGWIEGEVVYVERGEASGDYEGKNVEGKIILAHGDSYLVWKQAERRGVKCVLVYRDTGGPDHAVPYTGLFLTLEEAAKAKCPVLNVSRSTAHKILRLLRSGKKPVIRVRVDAEYDFNPVFPVVKATIRGFEGGRSVILIAHICHPMPGANDNASGSVALLELALTLNKLIREGILERPRYDIVFLWVPEYSGTLLYVSREKVTPDNVISVINLDMVGERQEKTGSTAILIETPLYMRGIVDALMEQTFNMAFHASKGFGEVSNLPDRKVGFSSYDAGSDHDIFISINIPGVMLNQWPDQYYHTDLDDLDKVDVENIKRSAVAAGSTAYYIALGSKDAALKILGLLTLHFCKLISNMFSEILVKSKDDPRWKRIACERYNIVSAAIKRNYEILGKIYPEIIDLTRTHLDKALAQLKVYYDIMDIKVEPVEMEDWELKIYTKDWIGPISLRRLSKILDEETLLKIQRLVREERIYRPILLYYLPNLIDGRRSVGEIIRAIEAEYGLIKVDVLKWFIDILEKHRLITTINGS